MPDSILLYRYLGHDVALRSIENRQLRVGRIKEFNDPFEWRMGLTGYVPEGEVVAESVIDSFVNEQSSKYGILCFSETAEDPVLWSHYADSHHGIAFEIDHLINPETLHKVQYDKDRPVVDINELLDPKGGDSYLSPLIKAMFFQKAPSWAYEQEYRVHLALSECEISGGHYFKEIPDDLLMRVILGFRCPLEVSYVRKALDKVGLQNTKVLRAKMDQHSYKILCK